MVHSPPGQLCSQLCDLQGELQVVVFTLGHRPQQAAVLLVQLAVSVPQLSHRSQQLFVVTEADRETVGGEERRHKDFNTACYWILDVTNQEHWWPSEEAA